MLLAMTPNPKEKYETSTPEQRKDAVARLRRAIEEFRSEVSAKAETWLGALDNYDNDVEEACWVANMCSRLDWELDTLQPLTEWGKRAQAVIDKDYLDLVGAIKEMERQKRNARSRERRAIRKKEHENQTRQR
jgi:hypothetical protein